jgi:uncharacterized CHY-type Zn-finger protein
MNCGLNVSNHKIYKFQLMVLNMGICPKCRNQLGEESVSVRDGEVTYDSCPVCGWNNKSLAMQKYKDGSISRGKIRY